MPAASHPTRRILNITSIFLYHPTRLRLSFNLKPWLGKQLFVETPIEAQLNYAPEELSKSGFKE
jgi:hypothetical protein